MTDTLSHRPDDCMQLPCPIEGPEQVHCFSEDEINAVNAALAARRPLLVRGEPGVGKTQLAKAVALDLKRLYVEQVIDIRTESRDLLWHFDAVGRLADAQLRGALGGKAQAKAGARGEEASSELQRELAIDRYLHPRALWWAFDWDGAKARAETLQLPIPELLPGCDAANGAVVLIDEIDKAESDVPNGLLEALGAGAFTPQGMTEPVTIRGPAPLVIITTNEERTLPEAFLRRCLVLLLALTDDEAKLKDHLTQRGRAHFPNVSDDVLAAAAEQLIADRKEAKAQNLRPLPGQAEYLDLVRALGELGKNAKQQLDLLETLRPFILKKHRGTVA